MVHKLDGMYSFVLYDAKKDVYFAVRDHVGITTMYQGLRSSDNSVWFASEMKSLNEDCDKIISFPPGHYYLSSDNKHTEYYHPSWFDHPAKGFPALSEEEKTLTDEEEKAMYTAIRTSLEQSVKMRLMSEVPYGVLLSGGLDSSLIASICMRMRQSELNVDDDLSSVRCMSSLLFNQLISLAGIKAWPTLHSFSIGLPGSPDLAAALKVAKFLGTVHHAFTFTVEEGIDAIYDVVHHLETYDVTTIRASTPMYLLSRKIKAMGVKMVLSGEGSDEIFGGMN